MERARGAWERLDPVGARCREPARPVLDWILRIVLQLVPQRVTFESAAQTARSNGHRKAFSIPLFDLGRPKDGLVERHVDDVQRTT